MIGYVLDTRATPNEKKNAVHNHRHTVIDSTLSMYEMYEFLMLNLR